MYISPLWDGTFHLKIFQLNICAIIFRSLFYSVVCLEPFPLIWKTNCLSRESSVWYSDSDFLALFKTQDSHVLKHCLFQSYISYGKVNAKPSDVEWQLRTEAQGCSWIGTSLLLRRGKSGNLPIATSEFEVFAFCPCLCDATQLQSELPRSADTAVHLKRVLLKNDAAFLPGKRY